MSDLPGETISIHEQINLPAVTPRVTQHWRLACGTRPSLLSRRSRGKRRSGRGCTQWPPI